MVMADDTLRQYITMVHANEKINKQVRKYRA
jgi:hypothetical protein